MNKLEWIFILVKFKDNLGKTSIICSSLSHSSDFPYRVYYDLKKDIVTKLDPYKNNSLQMTFKISDGTTIVNWLKMKQSDIPNGGFGVFALRPFQNSEFATAYLGEELPTKYCFGNIISILPRTNICILQGILQDDYWFGHHINHGSGHHRNCELKSDGTITAIRKIKKDEKLLLDYNRDCFCNRCRRFLIFCNLDYSILEKSVKCGKQAECLKTCKKCKQHLCFSCYDPFQI
jgi:hypothetical protein